jgi:hypothetical protein
VFISGRKYAFDAVGLNYLCQLFHYASREQEGNVGRSFRADKYHKKMENGDGKFVDVSSRYPKLASFNVEAASSIKCYA